MDIRPLASTGLVVSRIGLGLAALGRPAYINLGRDKDLGAERDIAAMEQRCHEVLDAAFAAGIRYVDAARSYGYAEAFLASWLAARQVPAGAIAIGSKWGYRYVGDWRLDAAVHELKDLSVEMLQRQIVESRELLGDRLGLYQIHSATLESGVLEDRRVLGELARLRSDGLAIGLSVSGPEQAAVIRRALEVDVDGINPFQSVQATWNLLETSAGAALADAKAQGWGVIIKEGMANGRLAAMDTTALAAVLSQPWVDVVLSGAVTIAQLRSNLRALDVAADGSEWPSIAEPPHEYWSRRQTLAWG